MGELERAKELLKETEESIDRLVKDISKLQKAAEKQANEDSRYWHTFADELNTDPLLNDEEAAQVLADLSDSQENRLYEEYYSQIDHYKKALSIKKQDQAIYKFFIDNNRD